jgi:hypothetical protein
VARMDNNITLFRGQVEEMLGKMQQTFGSLQGPSGFGTVLRGRELEIRGRARQSVGRMRLGFDNVTDTIRERGGAMAPFAPIVAIGLGLSAIAIFSPGTLNRAWNYLSRQAWIAGRQMPQTPYVEQARRTIFGGPTNR